MATGHAVSNVRWVLGFLIGLFFVTAGFAGLQALAQAPATGIPAAPPGGIDAAKLPDTNGVHLGMSQDQAVAAMKALYPGNLLTIYYDKAPTGTVWISRLSGVTAQNCSTNCESMEVHLTMPPSPVQVATILRTINLDPAKQPTMETTVASLRQKYGKELTTTKAGPNVLTWAYDEQGQPINPQGPSNWSPSDCVGGTLGMVSGSTDPKQPMEVDAALPPIPLAQQVPNLTKNLCNYNVYVRVQLQTGTIQGTQVVGQIFIVLDENSMMLRDAVADQQYFDSQAAAKQQQQQKNAQQQKAPAL
jgi:hypothetical protein